MQIKMKEKRIILLKNLENLEISDNIRPNGQWFGRWTGEIGIM